MSSVPVVVVVVAVVWCERRVLWFERTNHPPTRTYRPTSRNNENILLKEREKNAGKYDAYIWELQQHG